MALVSQVSKKIHMDQWDIVKFQILTYCYIKRIKTSDLDLNCLTLLAISGEIAITEFCDLAIRNEIFGSIQSVRNALTKIEKKQLLTKGINYKKKISINPNLKIQTSGNILLDFKFFRVESIKSEAPVA